MSKDITRMYLLKIDFELLRESIQTLYKVIDESDTNQAYHMESILALLDEIRDQAVDFHKLDEKLVFVSEDDE